MRDQTTAEKVEVEEISAAPEEAEAPQPAGPAIEVEDGARFEVLTSGSRPLFIGELEEIGSNYIQVVSVKGDEIPPVIFNTVVRLRGNLPGDRKRIITGIVTGSSKYFWRLEELSEVIFKDGRMAYRQDVSVMAKVVRTRERVSDAVPCHVVNVSEGGARFSCETKFRKGDEVCLLDLRLTEKGPTFSLISQILRVEEGGRKPNTYGCQFISLRARDQERLVEEIFIVQNQELRQRRI